MKVKCPVCKGSVKASPLILIKKMTLNCGRCEAQFKIDRTSTLVAAPFYLFGLIVTPVCFLTGSDFVDISKYELLTLVFSMTFISISLEVFIISRGLGLIEVEKN